MTMWIDLQNIANEELRKLADRKGKSSPVITTYVDPEEIREKYKVKTEMDLPERSMSGVSDELLSEIDDAIKDDPIKAHKIRRHKSSPTITHHMTKEEKEKYSNPSLFGRKSDPLQGEFDIDKRIDFNNLLEEQKELDKEYKDEWKEKRRAAQREEEENK